MIGAYLNFGRLTGADPCDCDPPAIQFSKEFTFETLEWREEYTDPSHEISIAQMDDIAAEVKFARYHTLGQKSTIHPKIHILRISFLTKFTILKSHFSQNSHFQNLIFHKIHNFKISFFTKFTFSKYHFRQKITNSKSHFSNKFTFLK